MSRSATDKRRKRRTKASRSPSLKISFNDESGGMHRLTAKLVDYSEKGLGIEVPSALAVGSRVTVKGTVNSRGRRKEIEFHGRVFWCLERLDGAYRAGLSVEERIDEGAFGQPKVSPPSRVDPSFDYYDLLQISPKAEPETIHRVYLFMAQRYHPDNQETGNEEMFKVITEAYRTLRDPETRAAYDVQRGTDQQVRWKIFDQKEAAVGVEAEKRKRQGILSLLYTRRVNTPDAPTLVIRELEDLLGCPREHLEVSLWYLRKKGWLERSDNGRFAITVDGFEQAETHGAWRPGKDRLLPSPDDIAAAEPDVQ